MKPRILILDSYYPDVIRSLPINPAGTYQSELQKILYQSFGTADFYSRNLAALGWDARDIITNHDQLNHLPGAFKSDFGEEWGFDCVFLQDLSLIPGDWTDKRPKLIAGQCSCPWPGDDNVRKCDIIFTSFPHYVPRIEALGVKAVYNPLAFDPIIFDRLWHSGNFEYDKKYEGKTWWEIPIERIYDCTFVGGVGNPGHWRYGMEVLNAVAEAIPTFKWWGYGADLLPSNSALRQKYQGEAWGLDMYRVFLQSKIVLNRHGEVAEGYANNMRMFEATGCGAMLLTEHSPNLRDLFSVTQAVSYFSASDAVLNIKNKLANSFNREAIALNGQARTLQAHTYAQRMKTVSDTLLEMLHA